ncbi:hypothetical protein CFIICLFH_5035 [Methylobacterium goesingense]|nr:hypothetical protein CFIICLFH_5035 [Methylobacterium goesingense]
MEIGTATAGIRVARPERRNRNTTKMTRTTAMTSVSSVSASEARMVALRSPVMVRSMSPGSAAFTCGIAALSPLIVSTTFEPGCL